MPIKKIFNFEKGSLQSTKCTPGAYSFVTAGADWKTHNEFTHNSEALIVAAAASGSLGRCHYINDKFIASDLCFILTPKDSKLYPVDLEFYHQIFRSIKSDLVQKTATGTSKLAINRTNFGNYEIPYFDIEHQKVFKKILLNANDKKDKLLFSNSNQKNLVNLISQKIFKDAISGKLTENWRSENPNIESTKELLKKIDAEKEVLIREKQIKKGKLQEAERQKDLIFDIPNNWEWCNLDSICKNITDGTHQTPHYTKSGKPFLSAQHVKPFKFTPDENKYVSEEAYFECIKNKKPEVGDLLVTRVGAIGEAAVIDQDIEFAFYVSLGLIQPFKKYINSNFIALVFNSEYGNKYSKGNVSSKGSSAGNFNLGRMRSFLIPLPPIAEQNEIVVKVDKLIGYLSNIKEEIKKNKRDAEMLMKSFLFEAFKN